MPILTIICWILTITVVISVIVSWKSDELRKKIFNTCFCLMCLTWCIYVIFETNKCLQYKGIDKYLNNEIVIDKTEITYDSQNNPIDTVYYYVKRRH